MDKEYRDPCGLSLTKQFHAGAIGGIGVAAFLASKVDKGFGAFMNESLVKVLQALHVPFPTTSLQLHSNGSLCCGALSCNVDHCTAYHVHSICNLAHPRFNTLMLHGAQQQCREV